MAAIILIDLNDFAFLDLSADAIPAN